MSQLRRLFGGLRVAAGQTTRRGLEEFFPTQTLAREGAKPNSLTQVPANVGTKQVVVGGDWKAWMLREKSTEDLHKLWFVLLKERNVLMTELQQCRAKNMTMPNASRRTKVKKSMARIKLVLHERSQIYKANQAKKNSDESQVVMLP
ncbi:hypothetical protein JM18_009722 [Phytophthora kernoviae]|uniref:Large ribosomal subunit protein uL29m n=2 Tax=Phytophthora kernoviae TaxID=325452 RepID=A0A3F2RAX7_9STRA|nr:hypothetical protein G195_010548 [Phytophthora kernoviae 00238/432]KAG2502651.1 hypothetical protein JM16_009705 [Phytophthora kernoviae]KAG2502905.1 hypothetical protein JM18_009722 [Phytophthora kernoviae]RLN50791.1 hypothetical protein BBP00_00009993 [Phytophthora kernoviae]RLN70579.1 hypothetical protein BBJ29_009956 [Phytophthora kernoviae]